MDNTKNILYFQFKKRIKRDITLLIVLPIIIMALLIIASKIENSGILTAIGMFLFVGTFINSCLYEKIKKINLIINNTFEFNDIVMTENKNTETIVGKKAVGYYKKNGLGIISKIYILPYLYIKEINFNNYKTKIKLHNNQVFTVILSEEECEFIKSKMEKR